MFERPGPDWPAEVFAIGGDLEPHTLLAAYASGLFPMKLSGHLAWWSPEPRGILPLDGMHVSRSLRRTRERFDIRIDTSFGEVVDGCADPRRPHGWIDAHFRSAYEQMHTLGHAHSIEVWAQDGTLAGGLYGVAVSGLFAAESKFHRVRDASKVAVWGLVDLLRDSGDADRRLLDVQWRTPHLSTLGVVDVDREEYQRRLKIALAVPPATWPRAAGMAGPG